MVHSRTCVCTNKNNSLSENVREGEKLKSFQTGVNRPRIVFYAWRIYLYSLLFFRSIQRIFVYFPCYHCISNVNNFFFSFIFVHSQKTNVLKIFPDKMKCTCIKDMSITRGHNRCPLTMDTNNTFLIESLLFRFFYSAVL